MTAELTLEGVEEQYPEAARREIENLRTALESRHEIGVALGLLMGRFQISEEQAFRYLSRCSQQSNVKLRELAAQTVREWMPQPVADRETTGPPSMS